MTAGIIIYVMQANESTQLRVVKHCRMTPLYKMSQKWTVFES